MGTAEEEAREAFVKMLMNGSQADRDRFVITTLLDMKVNGCARACSASNMGDIAKSGGIAGGLIAMVETIRFVFGK